MAVVSYVNNNISIYNSRPGMIERRRELLVNTNIIMSSLDRNIPKTTAKRIYDNANSRQL